jgi:thiamine biosynthesis lipoprotein
MALELHAASAGAFDVAVVPASQTSDRPSGNRKGAAPAPARGDSPTLELPASAAGNATGSAAIELLAHNRVRFHDPRLRIDLGGIAKGFAVDRALAVLREHGVPRALVNAGGDLAAFGAAGQRIDVRDPRDPCTALCWVELGDEALASSGGGFDPFRDARPQEPAVIDPRSRVPVTAVRGATVRALSCLLADALTKVVMIAGASAAALLQRYGASALFLSASGELHISGDWHQRVHLAP